MTAFLSAEQIRVSIPHLAPLNPFFGMSFLAFKQEDLPIGNTQPLVFSNVVQSLLERHYKPCAGYAGFYNPFKTSNQSKRWTKPRYGSTSLQRITTDTFGDTLIHEKKESSWGWKHDYIQKLRRHLGNRRIPCFHLAAWLFRDVEWPTRVGPSEVIRQLLLKYRFNTAEIDALFDMTLPSSLILSEKAMSEADLLTVIGTPPGWAPPAGSALRRIELREVGPAASLRYEPAERLNIVTGDNSLGKTFLLDCIWWALTNNWLSYPAQPKEGAAKSQTKILFSLAASSNRHQEYSASFNWDRQSWTVTPSSLRQPGLVIYARYDGSFAVHDPARSFLAQQDPAAAESGEVFLSRREVWEGTKEAITDRTNRWVCNGVLRDWTSWQLSGDVYKQQFSAFTSSLIALSPSAQEQLRPGEPRRVLPLDSRLIPTLRMPYGETSILHSSAAVQRIVALAYVLVWSWQEHLVTSSITRAEPERHLVLIIDEVEAHLHPLWQRVIVPAIMNVARELSSSVKTQMHIATHSPLVLASVEDTFDQKQDDLHHLRLSEGQVMLEELPFVKRGKADLWLMSDVFGLTQARSVPAERAIEDAKSLQLADNVTPEQVREVHLRLVALLAADDEFWPRWRYFAQTHGVEK